MEPWGEQFVFYFHAEGAGTVSTAVTGREERECLMCTELPWNSVVRTGLRSSMKHAHHSLMSLERAPDPCLSAKPCHASSEQVVNAGMEKTTPHSPLLQTIKSILVPLNFLKLPLNFPWPFFKRCPAISQLQMLLSSTTKCWSGSRNIMLLVPAHLRLALLFFRFVIAPSPSLSF